MKKLLTVCILLGAMVLFVSPIFGQRVWQVNALGQITLDGMPFRIKAGSWFGLDGRDEPIDYATASLNIPMELYIGSPFWAESGRTYDQDITEIKQMGFNTVRLPLVPQTLDPNDPQGRDPVLKNAQSVRIANARLALETVIKKLNTAGVYVLLDMHSCSNYVGWRAGRLDARPPYTDVGWSDYDYKREDCTCSATANPSSATRIQAYNTDKWLANLKTLAGFSSLLGVNNIIGIDIFNQPWDYSWPEWKTLIEQAYTAINSVNPDILLFVPGVGDTNGSQDGSPQTVNQTPHGIMGVPYRGENLYEAGDNPPAIPKERLVFMPQCFGPSVLVQGMFSDPNQPECATLQGDAFGDRQCQIVINPARLEPSWEEHFGYLKDKGYAICVEFGGNLDWPARAQRRLQNRYSYLTNRMSDMEWQTAFRNYLCKRGIYDSIYWAINPEMSDTFGIYTTPYDPISNTAGWGTWSGTDVRKINLLSTLYVCDEGPTLPPPTPTPTPTCCLLGDVNGDGTVSITDALRLAQYSAGLTVAIKAANADVNHDNIINIIDALFIARYVAGFGWPN